MEEYIEEKGGGVKEYRYDANRTLQCNELIPTQREEEKPSRELKQEEKKGRGCGERETGV